jgi:hypothetical protein
MDGRPELSFGTSSVTILNMTDLEFEQAVLALRQIPFREDFEEALYQLYRTCSAPQRDKLRQGYQADRLGGSKTWKNPVDYFRSDLTSEEQARQRLWARSLRDGSNDFRSDLLSIAFCYHMLAVRGFDADAELRELAGISAPKFAELVWGFVNRSPEEKSMKTWRLKIEQTPNGPVVDKIP